MNNAKLAFVKHWYDVRSPQKNTPETISDLHRSIKALSDKLYSTKTHFLLELIQNADDNSYPKGVEPELTFRLSSINLEGRTQECLCIQNNEIGFSEENLKALFQVGASSKKKKDGFIGEKGIGFKSVYSISDCPYIFSVGYQFKLPKECDMGNGVSLGYIVPVWVEKTPEISMSNTNIILPINTDSISIDELSRELFQTSPELILFLKKLNKITIIQEEEVGTTRYVISRKFDSNREIVTLDSEEWFDDCLKSSESTSFLYKVKEVEKPNNINIDEREGVLSREICIAIPLDDDAYNGKLFAYLPVKDGTGFPILINADFILTSSRENVASNKWNDWLWNEIPSFFAEIIEDVMCDDSYSIEQKQIIFSHIPTDADDPKFQKLIAPIYDMLKQTKCVLAYQSNNAEFPENCHLASSKVKNILSILNWSPSEDSPVLVSDALDTYSHILKKLCIPMISKSDVLDLFSQDFINGLSNQELIQFYMFLKNEKYDDLDNYSWVPVTAYNGKAKMAGAADDGPIYYPLESQNELSGLVGKEFIKLNFMRESFYEAIKNSTHSKELFAFLQQTWEIFSFNRKNYCIDLNRSLNKDFPGTDRQFIEISEYIINEEELPTVFVTNNGRVDEEDTQLVVSPDYQEDGWGIIWENQSSRKHITYLTGYSSIFQQKLLEKGIIMLFPLFEVSRYSYSSSSPAAKRVYYEARKQAAYSRLDETVAYFPIIPSKILSVFSGTIVNALIHFWTFAFDNYDNYIDTEKHDKYVYLGLKCEASYQNRFCYKEKDYSDLMDFLMDKSWLPTTKGPQKPGEVWCKTAEIEGVFGDTVPYLSTSLPSEIISFFGIHDRLTSDCLYNYIIELSNSKKQIGTELAKKLYKICDTYNLSSNMDYMADRDSEEKLIYVQNSPNLWYNANECLWNDESMILGSSFQYLSKHYPIELRSFFISLGVLEKPDAETYLKCWELEQKHNNQLAKPKFTALYQKLFDNYAEIPKDKWHSFVNKEKLVNLSGIFAHPKTFVFNDNASLAKVFEEASEINIAYIPPQYKASLLKWAEFYSEFSVKPVSQCVKSNLAGNQARKESLDLNNAILTPQSIAMIATWIHELFPNDYTTITSKESVIRQLDKFVIFDTKKPINVEYHLHTGKVTISRLAQRTVFLDIVAHEIYCNFNDEEWKRILALELSQYLAIGRQLKGLDSFIETVLGSSNLHRIEDKNWQVPSEFKYLLSSGQEEEKEEGYESDDGNSFSETQHGTMGGTTGNSVSILASVGASQEESMLDNHPQEQESKPIHSVINNSACELQRKPDILQESDSAQDNTSINSTPSGIKVLDEHDATDSNPLIIQKSKQQKEANVHSDNYDLDAKIKTFKQPQTGSFVRGDDNENLKKQCNEDFESQEDIIDKRPNYAEAMNEKFSRQGIDNDKSYIQDELEEEQLTSEMRQRRQTQVANEIRNMQKGYSSKKEEESRRNTGKNYSGRSSQEPSDCAKILFDMPDNALSLEEEMVLRSFAKDNDFRSNMRVMLAIAQKNNPMVRAQLEEHYHGRCQICHHTWQMANGKPFWIAAYLLPRSKGGVAHPSNAICLCAEHFVQWLHGTMSTQIDFTDIIQSIPEDDPHPQIHFQLAGKPVTLTYSQRHFCDLRTLLQVFGGSTAPWQLNNNSEEQNKPQPSPLPTLQIPKQPDAVPKKKNQTFTSFEELSDFLKKK